MSSSTIAPDHKNVVAIRELRVLFWVIQALWLSAAIGLGVRSVCTKPAPRSTNTVQTPTGHQVPPELLACRVG